MSLAAVRCGISRIKNTVFAHARTAANAYQAKNPPEITFLLSPDIQSDKKLANSITRVYKKLPKHDQLLLSSQISNIEHKKLRKGWYGHAVSQIFYAEAGQSMSAPLTAKATRVLVQFDTSKTKRIPKQDLDFLVAHEFAHIALRHTTVNNALTAAIKNKVAGHKPSSNSRYLKSLLILNHQVEVQADFLATVWGFPPSSYFSRYNWAWEPETEKPAQLAKIKDNEM